VAAAPRHPTLVCLRGELVVVGKSPDGDSIRFMPDTPDLLQRLVNAGRVRRSSDGTVQLRLDAIDAPETHYGTLAQPLGAAARDAALALCGFRDVQRVGETVTAASPERIAAAVLSGLADINGRPVALLAVGADLPADGSTPTVDDALLQRTINAAMLASGDAYLTPYESTAPDVRERMRALAAQAKEARKGVWAIDASAGFMLDTQDDIGPGGELILPKLFRRCSDYLRTRTNGQTLPDWLRAHAGPPQPEDDEVVVGATQRTRLSALIEQTGDRIGLPANLLDLVFVEK
jgi:endonuclease YncB( thermonuclease family)